jgi:RNA 2',3'-cyclic 3'-phosphodiesterase
MTDADSSTAGTRSTIRTFVAIDLPSDVKSILADVQAEVRRFGAPVKWVDPAGIHVTLKFLGQTQANVISDIERELEWGLNALRAFDLTLGEPGVFPTARAPRVLWIGLGGDLPSLHRAHDIVDESIAPLGFPSETKPFAPHLTLGRVRDGATPDERRRLGDAMTALKVPPSRPFHADEVTLMRSDLSRAGARYTPLFTIELRERK